MLFLSLFVINNQVGNAHGYKQNDRHCQMRDENIEQAKKWRKHKQKSYRGHILSESMLGKDEE